jgi:hypothetical protein
LPATVIVISSREDGRKANHEGILEQT